MRDGPHYDQQDQRYNMRYGPLGNEQALFLSKTSSHVFTPPEAGADHG